jgi:hypothetical protein
MMRRRLVCVALCTTSAVAAADDLGRLFFTPEQRASLDLARRSQSGPVAGEPYEGLTLSGVVTRSDGSRTVWINGRPQPAGIDAGHLPSTATIPLPSGEGRVKLRVGQTLDPTSGQVEESYRRPQPKPAPPPDANAAPAPLKPTPAAPEADEERADDVPR